LIRIDPAPSAALELLQGAVGGLLAAAVYLAALCLGALLAGHRAVAGLNAVGAWLVRWLQDAAPQALDNFYPDATLGGLIMALVVGASLGALLAGMLVRLPEDQPVAWGGVAGLLSWAAARWSLLPAWDPVLLSAVDERALLAAHLLAGLALGAWLQVGRTRRA
jgi:hypothetical protein